MEWAFPIASSSSDQAIATATDGAGHVYVAGYFWNTCDFDPGPGVFNMSPSGSYDAFILKLTTSGNFVWAKKFDGTGSDTPNDMVVDHNGNVNIIGTYSQTCDFDPGSGTYNLSSVSNSRDIFIVQLDENGNFNWAISMGGTTAYDTGSAIDVDNAGNVFSTGYFRSTADFDPSSGTFNMTTSPNRNDAFVHKLDQNGNFVWAKRIGGDRDDYGYGIAVDGSGNVITTGQYRANVDFNPNAGTHWLNSSGNYDADIFIQKMDGNGNFLWAKTIGAGSTDYGIAVETDGNDDILVTGEFASTTDFDPGSGTFNLVATQADIFVEKLDQNGSFIWAKKMGGNSMERGMALVTDSSNDIYLSGYYASSNADFDPGPGSTNYNSNGGSAADAFIEKLTVNGDFVWVKSFGGGNEDIAYNIALDENENLYAVSKISSSLDIDPGAPVVNHACNIGSDGLVQKFKQCGVITHTEDVSVCYGSSYTIGGNTYTTDGTYVNQLVAAGGCDSTVTTNLTVESEITGFQAVYICDGDSIEVGSNTYFNSGNYYDTLIAANGCDSILYTDLTVYVSYNYTDNVAICNGQSYTVGANTYTNTGTYIDVFTSASGCDSTIQTNLTVLNSNSTNQTITICFGDSYSVGSSVYTSSGNYSDLLSSNGGCDSIVNTDLTVLQEISSTQNVVLCNGESLTVGSSSYSTTGTYVDVLTAVSGCDSTVTSNLTILAPITSSQTVTLCDGQSINVGSSTHSTSGTYVDVLSGINGCDSTVTTNLTVEAAISSGQTVNICNGQSISVGSSTYTTSGTFVDVFVAANGCDSTVTTVLNVSAAIAHTNNVTVCYGGAYIVGTNIYASSGTYIDVLAAANGCDSTLTTNLTILPQNTSTQSFALCQGESVTIGGNTYSQAGSYVDVLTDLNGCDSTVTTTIIELTVNVNVNQQNNTLSADASGANYQWLDCATMLPIIGETSQSFVASNNGDYAVIIMENGCMDTSICYAITGLAVETQQTIQIKVYPNPSSGIVNIRLPQNEAEFGITVSDLSGRIILSHTYFNREEVSLKLYESTGVYLVTLTTSKLRTVERIVLE